MEGSISVFDHPPITTFSVVHYSGLLYPEIDPDFVHHYHNQLKKKWFIMKTDDSMPCVLHFNGNYENPVIVKGWNELKEIYNLHDNVEIKFDFYPPKIFVVNSVKAFNNDAEIPSFHSRSLKPLETCFFDIVLDAENIKLPTLKLPKDFAEFLLDQQIDYVITCGDRRMKETLMVLDLNDTSKTSLGYEWKNVCESNFFNIGDKIRFKFDLNNTDQRCHVFKLWN